MSQKVHPKGFRLRSTGVTHTGHQGNLQHPNQPTSGAWDSVWFSEPKKGKHFYTRILHEDQLIQDYTKGFFRSFGFYQQKCVIERKCNQELHITSYVLRTPKLQPSKIDQLGTRTRQEKVLQEGLQQGWIPFLIKSVICKILYDKSQKTLFLDQTLQKKGIEGAPHMGHQGNPEKTSKSHILDLESSAFGTGRPSILPILTPQENSLIQVLTNQKRFHDLWNSWILGNGKGVTIGVSRTNGELGSKGTGWWTHRSWSSTVYHPTLTETNALFPSESMGNTSFNLTYSIQPAKSLISSSQLIVDYIADKIEQSVSIQQIFNELLRFFETEALCLGPAFIKQTSSSETQSTNEQTWNLPKKINKKKDMTTILDQTDENNKNSYETVEGVSSFGTPQRPKVLGFRIICSGRLQISSFSKPAEKAESIEITRGVLPLNSFKADIDFAQTHATNAYGTCGIKVWVNRG